MNEAIRHIGLPVETALTSESGSVRIMARLAVSEASGKMGEWINAEVSRPDFNLSDFLIALARFQIQSHATLLHNFLGSAAFEHCAEMYRRMIDAEYVEHAERTRQHAEELL